MKTKWLKCCEEVPTIDPETGRCQNGCGEKKIVTHTPTPWTFKVDKNFPKAARIYADNIEIASASKHAKDFEEAEANAAFIVRAVNSHEKLLKLARELRDICLNNGTDYKGIDEAIAKAEGR